MGVILSAVLFLHRSYVEKFLHKKINSLYHLPNTHSNINENRGKKKNLLPL